MLWADGNYAGQRVGGQQVCGGVLAIVRRPAGAQGFHLLPKRWIVERTFAWRGRYRRLSKDYEYLPETAEAMIYVAMIHRMLVRLARQ